MGNFSQTNLLIPVEASAILEANYNLPRKENEDEKVDPHYLGFS
jgi:hypothetical protein